MVIDLVQTSGLCRLFADNTRMRLLHLLEQEELSVAELAAITYLAQPRVSTHLARLKEAGLVTDRRAGVSVYYRATEANDDSAAHALWQTLAAHANNDPLLQQDHQRIATVLQSRASTHNWADAVAGDMERHYSPGRTWEATARSLVRLLELGEVLDIASGDGVTAELLSPQAKRMVCVDISDKVVEAANKRTEKLNNIEFRQGDMHQLPLDDAQFDTVLMLHALTYSDQPAKAFNEAARVLRPGGRLLAATLKKHSHANMVAPYSHANLGFTPSELKQHSKNAGLADTQILEAASERRPPHFTVLTVLAQKP